MASVMTTASDATHKCQICRYDNICDEKYVGNCSNMISCRIDHMCESCACWDTSDGVWRCPTCDRANKVRCGEIPDSSNRKVVKCDMCSDCVPKDDYELILCRGGDCPHGHRICEPCALINKNGDWLCVKCDIALEEADAAKDVYEELMGVAFTLRSLSTPGSDKVEQLRDLIEKAMCLCNHIQADA